MYEKYHGLYNQKMPPSGLRRVWPADIFCLDCGAVLKKCFLLIEPTLKNKKTSYKNKNV